MACDADMELMHFRFEEWCSEVKAQVKALALLEEFRRTVLRVRERKKEVRYWTTVVEEYGSRPYTLVRCEIRLVTVDTCGIRNRRCPTSVLEPAEDMFCAEQVDKYTDTKEEVKQAERSKHLDEEVEDEFS